MDPIFPTSSPLARQQEDKSLLDHFLKSIRESPQMYRNLNHWSQVKDKHTG